MSGFDIAILVVCGVLAGGFAGAMGIGGGVIMVPVLTELVGIGQRAAQGTSLAVIVVTSIAATVAAHRRGLLDPVVAAHAAIGSGIGAIGGALLATQVIDEVVLRRIFGVLVLATAARLLRHLMVSHPDT